MTSPDRFHGTDDDFFSDEELAELEEDLDEMEAADPKLRALGDAVRAAEAAYIASLPPASEETR